MKPGDRMWFYRDDTGLAEVDIELVDHTYAAAGTLVSTGMRIHGAYKRFQSTRIGALEVALATARKAARKAEGLIYATEAERDAWSNTVRHIAGLVLTERERNLLEKLGEHVGVLRRRAVLCDYCDGVGFVHQVDGEHAAITLLGVPHKARFPGIEPCFDCEPCPECGRNGCGPGVRWVEVTP